VLCHGLTQEAADTIRQELLFQDLLNRGSAMWIFLQHFVYNVLESLAVAIWNWRVVAPQNFDYKCLHTICIKGMLQRRHLIENTRQTPDIRFLVIRLLLADFRRQIVRGADGGLCAIVCMLKYSGNSKIANFYFAFTCEEYVLCFEVAVKDFSVVDVFHCEADLNEPI
jgi:hypothetical protein